MERRKSALRTVCKKNQCTGCNACVVVCPKQCITCDDSIEVQNCIIDESQCIHCNLCKKVCLNESDKVHLMNPIEWKQGWSLNSNVRCNSSSGGAATEFSRFFIKENGIVYSCVNDGGHFTYKKATSLEDVKRFVGSKYVKSNPKDVYLDIEADLTAERRVLFIGLPCHVAALKLFLKQSLQANLYTVDLICHGTPSIKLFETFIKQYGYRINELDDIQFRVANQFSISSAKKGFTMYGACDRYTIGFLNALFYTENCYSCKFAGEKRVSDITIGDSWGSELPLEEQKKGISLMICQTEKGRELVNKANMFSTEVNVENAVAHNHQLEHPVVMTEKRTKFFKMLNRKMPFNKAVFKLYPDQCIKQFIKQWCLTLLKKHSGA